MNDIGTLTPAPVAHDTKSGCDPSLCPTSNLGPLVIMPTTRPSPSGRAALALALALSALLPACATTGSTYKSGVGDRFLEHPPYYAGSTPAGTTPLGHLPIVYQRGGSQSPVFDPESGTGTPIATLLGEMNAYLDSLGASVRLRPATAQVGTAPDVMFGCVTDASGDCEQRDAEGVLGRKGQTMRLAVGRPSESWVTWAGSAMDAGNVPNTLVITLEVGQYLPRQRGLAGHKEVELGTGYNVGLPWLTSLETPVSVLQLTGARIGRSGQAVRIGAEGLLARRTPFAISALGAQALISDEDVEKVRTARREDLPGKPLVWQAALRSLVEQLAGKS